MIGLTSQSHIYPTLELIRLLVRRGHQVSYAIGSPCHDLVARTGADVVSHPSLLPDVQAGKANGVTRIPKDAGEVMQIFLDEAMLALPRLIERYDPEPPELILADAGAMAAQVLAHRYGVPIVHLSITPRAWTAEQDEDDEDEDSADILAGLGSADSARVYYERCGKWLADNGITTDVAEFQSHPDGVLSVVPRVLQPGAEEHAPASVYFAGPCLDSDRLADRSWTPPASGRRVLHVSLGNTWSSWPEFYTICVEAFADSDWHVVLVAGPNADSPQLRHVPSNIEVLRRAPQLTVLEHASAFVTHAGAGGCVEALWYGVPTVSVPLNLDQFESADRLVELGVSRRLRSEELTPHLLRSAVDQVAADPEIARRLAAIRAEMRALGGAEGAADIVESFLPAPRQLVPADSGSTF